MGKILQNPNTPLAHHVIADSVPIVDAVTTPSLEEIVMVFNTPLLCQQWMNEHLTYTNDPKEYWQDPALTYELRGGDCEDWSLLACYFLNTNGYETHLIGIYRKGEDTTGETFYPGHVICVVKIGEYYAHLGNWGFCILPVTQLNEIPDYIYEDWHHFVEYNQSAPYTEMYVVDNPNLE